MYTKVTCLDARDHKPPNHPKGPKKRSRMNPDTTRGTAVLRTAEKRPGVVEKGSMGRHIWQSHGVSGESFQGLCHLLNCFAPVFGSEPWHRTNRKTLPFCNGRFFKADCCFVWVTRKSHEEMQDDHEKPSNPHPHVLGQSEGSGRNTIVYSFHRFHFLSRPTSNMGTGQKPEPWSTVSLTFQVGQRRSFSWGQSPAFTPPTSAQPCATQVSPARCTARCASPWRAGATFIVASAVPPAKRLAGPLLDLGRATSKG